MNEVLACGSNFYLKSKYGENKRKAEIETIYESLSERVRSKKVCIINEAGLKCELERLVAKNVLGHTPNTLTREQMQKVNEFKANERIITKKSKHK